MLKVVPDVAVPAWTEIDWSRHVHDDQILGRRLRYVDYGEGPPLLMVHGLGGCWEWWLENIPTLGIGHRVIAVDLPGFGDSDPLPPPATMATHGATLVALLDRLGIYRAVVCAHSMGGLVALAMSQNDPDRLAGLVLVCAGGIELGPRRLQAIIRGFGAFNAVFALPGVSRAFARRPRLRRLMFAAAVGDPHTLSPALAVAIVPRLAAPGFTGALVAGGSAANDVAPETVIAPTLLLWGARDPVLPVAGARQLARRLPDARLVVFDGVGHCPMFERPTDFNEAVGHFVDERFSIRDAG